MTASCGVAGCAKAVHGRGWCAMHYTRWRRHGSPVRAAVLTAAEAVAVPATGDRRWRERAACCTADVEMFHPAPGGSAHPAKVVCAGCGVLGDCRELALAIPARSDRHGVYGGLTAEERARVRRARGDAA